MDLEAKLFLCSALIQLDSMFWIPRQIFFIVLFSYPYDGCSLEVRSIFFGPRGMNLFSAVDHLLTSGLWAFDVFADVS